jgi:hypothetical protein
MPAIANALRAIFLMMSHTKQRDQGQRSNCFDAARIDAAVLKKKAPWKRAPFLLSNSLGGPFDEYDGWWFWPHGGQQPVSYQGRIRSELPRSFCLADEVASAGNEVMQD